MAKQKSIRAAKRKSRKMSPEEKIARDFEKQPRQITDEEIDAIETMFGHNQPFGPWRRTALATLAQSGARLIEICEDRKSAETFAYARKGISNYAENLRVLAGLMEKADARLLIAVCAHPEAIEISREVDARWAKGPSDAEKKRTAELNAFIEDLRNVDPAQQPQVNDLLMLVAARLDAGDILEACRARGLGLEETIAELRKPRLVPGSPLNTEN